jgi:hypothetical protein
MIQYTVTYPGCSIHDGTLLHSKSQYTTVKHSRKLSEHTYTSDPHGTGTLTPIEFFQQDLLWQSSNTHSHSCSQKASKHNRSIRRRAIGPLALHNSTSPYTSLTRHLPAPTIGCLHRPPYKLTCSSRQSVALRITSNSTRSLTQLVCQSQFFHSNVSVYIVSWKCMFSLLRN